MCCRQGNSSLNFDSCSTTTTPKYTNKLRIKMFIKNSLFSSHDQRQQKTQCFSTAKIDKFLSFIVQCVQCVDDADAHPVIFCVMSRMSCCCLHVCLCTLFATLSHFIEDTTNSEFRTIATRRQKPTHKTSIEQIIFYL